MGRVGRADGVDDGEGFFVPQILEGPQGRMQGEESVEVEGGFVVAGFGFGDGERGTQVVILAFGVREDGVQAIHCAALEDDDQQVAGRFGIGRGEGEAGDG